MQQIAVVAKVVASSCDVCGFGWRSSLVVASFRLISVAMSYLAIYQGEVFHKSAIFSKFLVPYIYMSQFVSTLSETAAPGRNLGLMWSFHL